MKRNNFKEMCAGQVIVLKASTEALVERQLRRGGRVTPADVADGSTYKYLESQKKRMFAIYKDAMENQSAVDTDCCSVATSVKDAVRIIHLDDYHLFDFSGRLKAVSTKG